MSCHYSQNIDNIERYLKYQYIYMWVYGLQSEGQILRYVRKTAQNYKNVSVLTRLLGIDAFSATIS
jgi:hypothetical protein